jgi:hypothetical protein
MIFIGLIIGYETEKTEGGTIPYTRIRQITPIQYYYMDSGLGDYRFRFALL